MIAGWHGHQIDLVSLRLQHTASSNGTSLHAPATLAEQFQLRTGAQAGAEDLRTVCPSGDPALGDESLPS